MWITGLTRGIALIKHIKSKTSDSRFGVLEKYKALTIVEEKINAATGLSAIIFLDVTWEFSASTETLALTIFFILQSQKAKRINNIDLITKGVYSPCSSRIKIANFLCPIWQLEGEKMLHDYDTLFFYQKINH